MKRPALLAALLLLPALARAANSGTGVPETGGPGAGAASADAKGLSANPAAAVGANGSEIDADIAANVLALTFARAGNDPNTGKGFPSASSFNLAPVPYFAIRSDFGHRDAGPRKHGEPAPEPPRFGLGFSLSIPFGRQVSYPDDSPGRYSLVTLNYFTAYAIPSVAMRVTPHWRIGAGPILAYSSYEINQRVDLAPQLNAASPGATPAPPESPVLDGTLDVKSATALSPGFTVGTLVDLLDGQATIGAGFLSGAATTATGKAVLTPSQDFAVQANSNFTLKRSLPPIYNLGGRMRPAGLPFEFSLEGQYVAWHVVSQDQITLSNAQLAGSNADIQALLQALNVSQNTLVSSLLNQQQTLHRGWQDSFNVMVGAEYIWSPVRLRVEFGYDEHAIPDPYVTTGNLDFDTITLGANVNWEPKEFPFSAGLGISQYLNNGRNVNDSAFSSSAPLSSGLAYPSGNGAYGAVLTRVGMRFGYRF